MYTIFTNLFSGSAAKSARDAMLDQLLVNIHALLPEEKQEAIKKGQVLQEFPPKPFSYDLSREADRCQYSQDAICAVYTAVDYIKKHNGLNDSKSFVMLHGKTLAKILSPVSTGSPIPHIVDDRMFRLSLVTRDFIDKLVTQLTTLENYFAAAAIKKTREKLSARIAACHPDPVLEFIQEERQLLEKLNLYGSKESRIISTSLNNLSLLEEAFDERFSEDKTDVLFLELKCRLTKERDLLFALQGRCGQQSENLESSVMILSKTVTDGVVEGDTNSDDKSEYFSVSESGDEEEKDYSKSVRSNSLSISRSSSLSSLSSSITSGSLPPSPVEEKAIDLNNYCELPTFKLKSVEEIINILEENAKAQHVIEGLQISTDLTRYYLLQDMRKQVLKHNIFPDDDSLDEKIILGVHDPIKYFGVTHLIDQDFADLMNQLRVVDESYKILNGPSLDGIDTLELVDKSLEQHEEFLLNEIVEKYVAYLSRSGHQIDAQIIKDNILQQDGYLHEMVLKFSVACFFDDLSQAIKKYDNLILYKIELEKQKAIQGDRYLVGNSKKVPENYSKTINEFHQHVAKNLLVLNAKPGNVITHFIRAVISLVLGVVGVPFAFPFAVVKRQPSLIFLPGEKVSGYLSGTHSSLFGVSAQKICADFVAPERVNQQLTAKK